MSAKSKRERIRERRKKARRRSNLIWLGVVAVVLILIGILVLPALKPALGETVALMPSGVHIALNSDPGQYTTDPPTSGPHYGSQLDAGFYDESDFAIIGPFPAGYIIHSMEHGYVVFWYNCNLFNGQLCDELKANIQNVMDDANNIKVIAVPWEAIDVPLVMTSWGRIQEFDDFDTALVSKFVSSNRNKSPEPNAP